MTEQPPSVEALIRKYIKLGVKFVVGPNVYAEWMKADINALIVQHVSAETERWQNRDRQRLEQIDRLQETVQFFQSARDERPAPEPTCEGGVPLGTMGATCPKCGATDNDICGYTGEAAERPAPESVHLTVVDYTERAREIVDAILRLHDRQADESIRLHWTSLVIAALSAVASKCVAYQAGATDAAPLHLDTLEADEFSEISDVERGERGHEYVAVTRAAISDALSDQRAALLARLREPDVRVAVIEALEEGRPHWITGVGPGRSGLGGMADAAIARIAEMLK